MKTRNTREEIKDQRSRGSDKEGGTEIYPEPRNPPGCFVDKVGAQIGTRENTGSLTVDE